MMIMTMMGPWHVKAVASQTTKVATRHHLLLLASQTTKVATRLLAFQTTKAATMHRILFTCE